MVVSKPCQHPECPPRQGIIRGQYESVEIIREIPSAKVIEDHKSKKTATSSSSESKDSTSAEHKEGSAPAIEWIMITRSDPGGSVPRFMIEKGTPPGIAGDAAKFVKWLEALSTKGNTEKGSIDSLGAAGAEDHCQGETQAAADPSQAVGTGSAESLPVEDETGIANRTGLYGIITGAFGAASSVVASGLRRQFDSSMTSDSEERSLNSHPDADEKKEDGSDLSSVRSFASAMEKSETETKDKEAKEATESRSEDSKPQSQSAHEKELKKLQDRRRKLDEKVAKMQERMEQKQHGDKEKDAASLAKAREKTEKEVAKQEAKYRREVKKLEEKQEREERKAEARRRKAMDREEKANLSLELEKVRVDRDLARKHVQLLEGQVKELQSQNMAMAAKLVNLEGAAGATPSSSELNLPTKSGGAALGST
jgi:hypothetical protein